MRKVLFLGGLVAADLLLAACATSEPTPTATTVPALTAGPSATPAATDAPAPPAPTNTPRPPSVPTPTPTPTTPPVSETIPTQSQGFHIPPTLSGTMVDGKVTYDLIMQQGMKEFLPGLLTATLGYNGNYLGPTLIMNKGDEVVINVTNNLGGPHTTTHWHGFHLPAIMDGGPHQEILSGETWSPTFTILNRASTYWYHPHLHPVENKQRNPDGTSGQVFRGLAGMIIVRDQESEQLVLPNRYGVDDIPLIIQDRSFNEDGSFLEFPKRQPHPKLGPDVGPVVWPFRKGDKFLVNGVISPLLEAPAQMVRFRILNASNNRIYNLGFDDNRTFYQIGSDGGLLEAPVPLERLVVAPSERMEIVVDFGNDENATIRLKSYNSELGTTYVPDLLADDFDRTDFDIFTIAVGGPTRNPVTTLPASLTRIDRILSEEAVNTDRPRVFELTAGRIDVDTSEAIKALDLTFTINDKAMDLGRIDEVIQLGDTEIWAIVNSTGQAHPMHIHGDSFQVLSRDGSFDNVPANERGWKDSIIVRPNEIVHIIKRFEDFADPAKPFMMHCHSLDHEDGGMMLQWIVVEPGSVDVSPKPTAVSTGATRIKLNPIKDNTLYESPDGSISNGAGGHLFSGTNNKGNMRRAVIAFDIAGNIPAGATISSVTLQLNMSRTAGGPATVSLHKVLADWGQGSSDAPGNEGQGIESAPGDATWVHRFFNTETWEKAGGDFSEGASASIEVGGLGPYIWGPESEMLADVQLWLENPDSYFGWILIGDESSNQTTKRFNSMENFIQVSRPVLIVEFQQ